MSNDDVSLNITQLYKMKSSDGRNKAFRNSESTELILKMIHCYKQAYRHILQTNYQSYFESVIYWI